MSNSLAGYGCALLFCLLPFAPSLEFRLAMICACAGLAQFSIVAGFFLTFADVAGPKLTGITFSISNTVAEVN